MAETKTYKGKKNDYYTIPHTPGRHDGGNWEYLRSPIDTTNTMGQQSEPTSYNGQFGRKDAESEAD